MVRILDCDVDNLAFEEALERLLALARGKLPSYVVTPNVDHLLRLRRDAAFRAAYAGAALRLADGAPLLWAARLQGTPLHAKNSGSDLLPALCTRAAEVGLPVFFLGGLEGAAELAARRLAARNPGLRVVGWACPPLGFENDARAEEEVATAIRRAAPAILFVALGAPKQELWMHRHHGTLEVPLSLGVGASLDFEAGLRRRAPRWMQRSGLEWLHRLAAEPRRLGGRYLRDLPFLLYLGKLALRRLRAPPR